jgi:hypothetical protein
MAPASDVEPDRSTATGHTIPPRSLAGPLGTKTAAEAQPLKVQNIRVEREPTQTASPDATVKFEIFNEGSTILTDITLRVSIVERPNPAHPDAAPQVRAGPYTIKGTVALQPGYLLNYQMRLRNLPSDCGCTASVEVLSVRQKSDADWMP